MSPKTTSLSVSSITVTEGNLSRLCVITHSNEADDCTKVTVSPGILALVSIYVLIPPKVKLEVALF